MKKQSSDVKKQNKDRKQKKHRSISWKMGMALAGCILTGCGSARPDLNEYMEVAGLEDTLSFAMISYLDLPKMDSPEAEETARMLQPEITGAEEEMERRMLETTEVFSSPSETASRIGSVQSGTRVAVIGYLEESGWGKISFNGRVAYVRADTVENISSVSRAETESQTGNAGQNGARSDGQPGQNSSAGASTDPAGGNQTGQGQTGAGTGDTQGANGNSGGGNSEPSAGRPDSGQNTGSSGAGAGTASPTYRPGGSSPAPGGSSATSTPGTPMPTPTPDLSTSTPQPPTSTPEPDTPTPEPPGPTPESPEPTQDPPGPTVSPSEPTTAPTEAPEPSRTEEPDVPSETEEPSQPAEDAGL